MRWKSPWGVGFPGWHLECSAMSMKYLGESFDIHGGGLENIFPHHEDEIAQSEAATGKPFVKYWLHNNMVTVEGQKMGKSLGNFITLKDAFAGRPPLREPVRPLVIRYFILTSHYRSPLDFSAEALQAARGGLERLEQTVRQLKRRRASAAQAPAAQAPSEHVSRLVEQTRREFLAAMDDDFNTAAALGHLGRYTREVNRLLDGGEALSRPTLDALEGLYQELGEQILGLLRDVNAGQEGPTRGDDTEHRLIEALVETRARLREARQFELADSIRERLAGLGIELKDGPQGTVWRYK